MTNSDKKRRLDISSIHDDLLLTGYSNFYSNYSIIDLFYIVRTLTFIVWLLK